VGDSATLDAPAGSLLGSPGGGVGSRSRGPRPLAAAGTASPDRPGRAVGQHPRQRLSAPAHPARRTNGPRRRAASRRAAADPGAEREAGNAPRRPEPPGSAVWLRPPARHGRHRRDGSRGAGRTCGDRQQPMRAVMFRPEISGRSRADPSSRSQYGESSMSQITSSTSGSTLWRRRSTASPPSRMCATMSGRSAWVTVL
jgi:hypothetical protein